MASYSESGCLYTALFGSECWSIADCFRLEVSSDLRDITINGPLCLS